MLEEITYEQGIKELDLSDLEILASDIRRCILEIMSVSGGHLASNLGTVELIIALHRVFSLPQDKLIFDTSHQAYTHKLLTPRTKPFSSIRQYLGLSGFCHPPESPYDHFYAGHAGTGISLALGVAKGRDLSGDSFHVLPFVCDAPMGCGLTLEALNNMDAQCKNFVLILNDNAMSISHCVGNVYNNVLGSYAQPRKVEQARSFFNTWGLEYVGPIDGHDIESVIETLEKVKGSDHPVVVHAITTKGYGYNKASEKPIKYHGVKPFDLETGEFHKKKSGVTFPKVFGQYLLELASFDDSIVAVTPAMAEGSCLNSLMKQYPSRCIDVGIAEGHAVTFAGGLAFEQKTVFACIYATFFQRAFDSLFQDVCLQQLPVIFALDRAGLSPQDGVTHHGIYDLGFLQAMPHLVIAQPRNGDVLKDLMTSAPHWNCPCAIRYPNRETNMTPDYVPSIRRVGKGEILAQGKDICILALGNMAEIALKVRDMLVPEGIEVTVVDPVFVKPIDDKLLEKLLLHHSVFITLEEHALSCGFGQCVNNFFVQNHYTDKRVYNLGIGDDFVEHGSYAQLMRELQLDAESVALFVRKVCS